MPARAVARVAGRQIVVRRVISAARPWEDVIGVPFGSEGTTADVTSSGRLGPHTFAHSERECRAWDALQCDASLHALALSVERRL